MKSVWTDETGRIINKVNKISCCVLLTSLYLKKLFKKKIKKIKKKQQWKLFTALKSLETKSTSDFHISM